MSLELPCSPFDYRNLTSTSLQYIFFITPGCLNNEFVFILHITFMSIFGLISLIFLFLFLWHLAHVRGILPPNILLAYAAVSNFFLFLSHLSNFLAFRGVLRQFIQGLPVIAFFSSTIYVTILWLRVIVENPTFKGDFLGNSLTKVFIVSHVMWLLVAFPAWMVAGAFDLENFRMNNLLMSISLVWGGSMGMLFATFIRWVGFRLLKILNQGEASWNSEEKVKMSRLAQTIVHFTNFQSLSHYVGSSVAISMGVWGFATFSGNGPESFFFVWIFFFEVVNCIGVSVTASLALLQKSSTDSEGNSRKKSNPSSPPESRPFEKKVEEYLDEMKVTRNSKDEERGRNSQGDEISRIESL